MNKQHNYCIILAGGIGRRLWPVSKQAKPKQFVDIFGVGRTLLQQTFDRFARIMDKNHIIVSTYKEYVPLVKEQLPELPDSCILAEPVQLSTAPAAAWASCHIANIDRDANIVVSPADQFIVNEANFAEQIAGGLDFVSKHDDFLVMGAVPTVPNTAYGYIQQGRERIDDTTSRVKSFSENQRSNMPACLSRAVSSSGTRASCSGALPRCSTSSRQTAFSWATGSTPTGKASRLSKS